MPIKPPELLNRLPSVADLLEKPPIRALAARWNRSVVASGLKSFLDELRTDFERHASGMHLPTIRDLAERAVSYIVSRQHQSLGVAINATGWLWGPPWANLPLADAALEKAMAIGREYACSPSRSAECVAQTESLLCRLSGAEAAAVVHSYAGGLWLALSTFVAEREVLVARAEVGDVGGEALPSIAEAAHAKLREIGSMDSALATDFLAAVSPNTAAILAVSPDNYRIVGHTACAELPALVALARDKELMLIDAIGAAPLAKLPESICWTRRTAQSSLNAGAKLVLVRGDGLVGGPPCGILLGSKNVIEHAKTHPLFAASMLDPLRSAALAATLETYEQSNRSLEPLPVWQALTVSIENLRNRAERIAPQLARNPMIGAATAIETRSPLAAAMADGLPSFGVAVTAADGNLAALEKRLYTARFPIVGRREADRIVLDLRTVPPRHDVTLVDAIVGPVTSSSSEPAEASLDAQS